MRNNNVDIDFDAAKVIYWMLESVGIETNHPHERAMCGACGQILSQTDFNCYRCDARLVVKEGIIRFTRNAIRTWRDMSPAAKQKMTDAVHAAKTLEVLPKEKNKKSYSSNNEARQLGFTAL